jgi:hypothetical protein
VGDFRGECDGGGGLAETRSPAGLWEDVLLEFHGELERKWECGDWMREVDVLDGRWTDGIAR